MTTSVSIEIVNVPVGQRVEIVIRITDETQDPPAADDPTALTFTFRKPDGTPLVFNIGDFSNPAVGEYRREHTFDAAGEWRWRLETTGVVVVKQGIVQVARSILT